MRDDEIVTGTHVMNAYNRTTNWGDVDDHPEVQRAAREAFDALERLTAMTEIARHEAAIRDARKTIERSESVLQALRESQGIPT